MLHSADKPLNDHHCPDSGHWASDWTLNPDNNKCYLIGRKSIDDGSSISGNSFTAAREYCTSKGSELVSIHSMEENSWLVPRLVGNVWLGMKMSSPGVIPKTWLDGSPFDYANWREGKPSSGADRIYARLFGVEDPAKYGTWEDVADKTYNYYPVCMIDAISGPINPPRPDATVPSHDLSKLNCEHVLNILKKIRLFQKNLKQCQA